MESWLKSLLEAEKTCVVSNGVKKVAYKFIDGKEMVEEYNMDTNVVVKRSWKQSKVIGGEACWEVEVGDTSISTNLFDTSMIEQSSSEPIISMRITRNCLEWRIRNLPYPLETYIVLANNDERRIVVRTTNNKYFKKLPIPDFDRLKIPIEQARISISHKYNTLIISYKKPPEMLTFERLLLEELNKLEAPAETPLQCPTS